MNFEKLTQYLDSLQKRYRIPATDIIVKKNHEVLFRHMTGHKDYGAAEPVDKNTVYRLFSATKVITMTAVMQLIERKKLGLYDELRHYLPEFGIMKVTSKKFEFSLPMKWPQSDEPCHLAHNTIRIIDLMSMTAGMSYDTKSSELMKLKETNPNACTRDVVAEMAKMPLVFEPGTGYGYSLSHDVLAAVVEVVSGKNFFSYLKENIFLPLGATDLHFHWEDDKEVSDRICAIYMGMPGTDDIVKDDGSLSDSFKITKKYESGGAGLAASVASYSLIIDALANGGVGANGARILSEQSVKMFMIPYTTGVMSADFKKSGIIGYEYGLGVRVLVDASTSKSPLGEFGWDGAAGAYALIDPIHKVSVFYVQHIVGFPKAYSEIHPTIRDLVYEGLQEGEEM